MRICRVTLSVITSLLIFSPSQTIYANGMPVTLQSSPSAMFVPTANSQTEVVSEELTFDFRNSAYNKTFYGPWVTARYNLKNPSAKNEQLTVAFLYLKEVHNIKAFWDGKEVQINPSSEASFPPGWQPPKGFPPNSGFESHWLNPSTGEVYTVKTTPIDRSHAALISIELPADSTGELLVQFRQDLTACDQCNTSRPFVHYTYLLSPARYWSSFRELTVKVIAPPWHDIATEPRLTPERSGLDGYQVFSSHYSSLPQGEFHITIRKKPQFMKWFTIVLIAGLFGIMLFLRYRNKFQPRL